VDVLRDSNINSVLALRRARVYELMATLHRWTAGLRVIVSWDPARRREILKAIAAERRGILDDAATPEEVNSSLRWWTRGRVGSAPRIVAFHRAGDRGGFSANRPHCGALHLRRNASAGTVVLPPRIARLPQHMQIALRNGGRRTSNDSCGRRL